MIVSINKTLLPLLLLSVIFLFNLILINSAWSKQGGIKEIIKESTEPVTKAETSKANTVIANFVLAQEEYNDTVFWVETRKDKLDRYRCNNCHENKPAQITGAAEAAHGDIRLVHGTEQNKLSCFVCHNQANRDLLMTEEGKTIDFDHSYNLCGYCHFRQKRDWIGGAHGKRIANWAGQRVIKNCTSCHNPHDPSFEKRWPETFSKPLE